MDPSEMTVERFAEHIGDRFKAAVAEEERVELELIEATPHRAGARRAPGFALLFRGPLDKFLRQQLWGLEHDRLGTFVLFLSPVGQSPDGFTYESVFTRVPVSGDPPASSE